MPRRLPLLLAVAGFAAPQVFAQHEHAAHGHAAPPASAVQSAGFFLPHALPLTAFTLVDQDAEPFGLADLEGQWTLVVFGYTHCPDVCPTTLLEVRETKRLLRERAPTLEVRSVFVTIDPERDTPAQVAQYVDVFGERLVGLTGTPEQLAAFAEQFRVKYAVTTSTPSGYFLDHTSSVALLTPAAELRALFSVPLRPEQLAADLADLAIADARAARDVAAANDAGTRP
jgi:protein SCO1/2